MNLGTNPLTFNFIMAVSRGQYLVQLSLKNQNSLIKNAIQNVKNGDLSDGFDGDDSLHDPDFEPDTNHEQSSEETDVDIDHEEIVTVDNEEPPTTRVKGKDSCQRNTSPEESYQGMLIGPAIVQHMVDSFSEGLISPHLRIKLLRDRPQTLQEAITIATNETNLYNTVLGLHNYTQHKPSFEPMGVDHSRSVECCFKYGKRGHRGKECKNVNSTENRRKIYCFGCGQEGNNLKF